MRIIIDTTQLRRFRDVSLRRLQRNVKGNAWKEILDSEAELLAEGLRRQWGVDMTVRNRSFQRNMFRVTASRVSGGVPTRGSRVENASADTMLRLQVRGGIRRPEKAQYFQLSLIHI